MTNYYDIGVPGRDIVLNTAGKVYVKRNDRYYELKFEEVPVTDDSTSGQEQLPEIVIVDTKTDAADLAYPGDNMLVLSLDGGLWICSNSTMTEWTPDLSDIEFDDLTINGVLTVNNPDGTPLILNGDPNKPPMTINSKVLVNNLNAQYLNGIQSNKFPQKDKSETITGTWNFNDMNVSGVISNQRLILDFNGSNITVDNLTVKNSISVPNNEVNRYKIFGTNEETWVGKEFIAKDFVKTLDLSIDFQKKIVSFIYDKNVLYKFSDDSGVNSIDYWLSVFTNNNLMRNFKDQNEIDAANTILASQNQGTIDDYMDIYYQLYDADVNLQFQTYGYILTFTSNVDLNVNDIIKNDIEYYQIIDVGDREVKIRGNTELYSLKFVKLGSLVNPNYNGGIVFDSTHDNVPYTDVLNNVKYNRDVDGKLLDNNNIISRNGNLLDLAEDDVFGEFVGVGSVNLGIVNHELDATAILDDIKNYAKIYKTSLYYKDFCANLNNICIFNSDGSGMISNGRMFWTKDNLTLSKLDLDDVKITNSSFETGVISDSALSDSTGDNIDLTNSSLINTNTSGNIVTSINKDGSLNFNNNVVVYADGSGRIGTDGKLTWDTSGNTSIDSGNGIETILLTSSSYTPSSDIGNVGKMINLVNNTSGIILLNTYQNSYVIDGITMNKYPLPAYQSILLFGILANGYVKWVSINRSNTLGQSIYGNPCVMLAKGYCDENGNVYYTSMNTTFDDNGENPINTGEVYATHTAWGYYELHYPAAWDMTRYGQCCVPITGGGSTDAGYVSAAIVGRQNGIVGINTFDDSSVNDGAWNFGIFNWI